MASGEPATEPTYTLYRRGIELLEDGDFDDAAEPLAEAARRAPEKSSVREALGRAYYRAGRFAKAAIEFEAVVEAHHVDDYAHFCLGRALSRPARRTAPATTWPWPRTCAPTAATTASTAAARRRGRLEPRGRLGQRRGARSAGTHGFLGW